MMKAVLFIVFSLFFSVFAVVDSNQTQKVTASTVHLFFHCFKGEVSRKFDVFSKPKNVCLITETKKKLSSFVINYHPSAINCRLVPLARDRVGRNGLKLEKC